jgi:hypothetical protein
MRQKANAFGKHRASFSALKADLPSPAERSSVRLRTLGARFGIVEWPRTGGPATGPVGSLRVNSRILGLESICSGCCLTRVATWPQPHGPPGIERLRRGLAQAGPHRPVGPPLWRLCVPSATANGTQSVPAAFERKPIKIELPSATVAGALIGISFAEVLDGHHVSKFWTQKPASAISRSAHPESRPQPAG